MILEFFGESDAKLFAQTINRQADLVDSLHRQAVENEALTSAIDRCVEALRNFLTAASGARICACARPGLPGNIPCAYCGARAALEKAEKARGE